MHALRHLLHWGNILKDKYHFYLAISLCCIFNSQICMLLCWMHIALCLYVLTMVLLSWLHILCVNNQTTLCQQNHSLHPGTSSHLPVVALCSQVPKQQKHVWHRASETLDTCLLSFQTDHDSVPPIALLCHSHHFLHRVADLQCF